MENLPNKESPEMISEKLSELKEATKESIEKKKKFDYKIVKGLADILGDEKDTYYEKYLRKTVGEKIDPIKAKKTEQSKETNKKFINKKRKGKDDEIDFTAMPQHHYNTLLAMAFSKAHKVYSDLRSEIVKNKEKIFEDKVETNAKIIDVEYGKDETRGLSGLEYLMMSKHLFSGKNSNIKLAVKKGETEILKEYAENEYLIFKALDELRNFHSHIFHEPGPVSFKNLYGDEYKPEKKLTENEWIKARDWFINRFNDAKEHKLNTLAKVLEREGITKEEIENANEVIERISGYSFEYNDSVSREALLFIACMFLRKSDAAYFTKKWTGMKKAEGVWKSTQSFFTDNALKESKSILTHNIDLYKYRQIIGILSTMPLMKTESLKPFYDFIKTNNDSYSEKAEKARNKEEKEKIQAFIIPQRKSNNYTYWYMKYLNDNKLLDGFRIAYYKTPEDREKFRLDNGFKNSTELKLNMKLAKGSEKKRLTELFKETQRNFIFKTPSVEYDNFCVKKLNVFFQTDIDFNGQKISVQLSVSPDFLMKWVFVHLITGDDKSIRDNLKEYVEEYYQRCITNNFKEPLMNLDAKKVFPGSLIDTVELEEKIDKTKIIKSIDEKYNELKKFDEENKSSKAPWKFASKRKIDIILEYVHLIYSDRAFDEKKSLDTMRHEALNDFEYMDTFEFLRYFGRDYQTDEFKKLFFEDKKLYFSPILKAIKQLDSLEGVFNFAITGFLHYLKETKEKVTDENIKKYGKVFKVTGKSLTSNIGHHSEMFAVNHCVPPELIKLEGIEGYTIWKSQTKDKKWISDFAFIRNVLESRGGFSNTDYLMKEIMPLVKFPKNERGTIKGNMQMFMSLARNKTNELMLWEIAKHYWKLATGSEFSRSFKPLEKNSADIIKNVYRLTNPYYTIYQEDLDIKIKVKDKNNNKNKDFIIKIMPKKFDDEYQYYEQEHIVDYIENYIQEKGPDDSWYFKEPDKKKGNDGRWYFKELNRKKEYDGHWHFEELNKKIKDELARYLDDIYLLMTVEKHIVQKDFDKYASLLKEKDSKLPPYYIKFNRDDIALNKVIFDELKQKNGFNADDLNKYRNNVLHQQLQPKKEKYIDIRKSLIEFCSKNNLIRN
jgi:hypothetical protein